MRPKVILYGRLPPEAQARLDGRYETVAIFDEETLLRMLSEAQGLLSLLQLRVDDALLERGPRLRIVANFAVGYDNIDVAACTRRRIVVTNTPDVLTETTADMAFALLLAVARRIPEADRTVRDGTWEGFSPTFLLGQDVFGKTLGILGLGRIGRAVARRGEGFGMRILYSGPRPVQGVPYAHVALETLLEQADYVSIHCPLTPETRHLIGAGELGRMRPDGVLINTARGPIVDEAALAAWVEAGHRVGLDVFEGEPNVHPRLLASPHCVLSPHIGSATRETRGRMAALAAAGIDDVLSGRRPAHPVNPEVLG